MGPPKSRDRVSDGEQEREGESSWAGEMGLGIAAGAGAPKLRLSACGWTCRGAPGMWILGAVMAHFFLSCGVYGRLWFWHAVPVSASPQTHGLGMPFPAAQGSAPKVRGLGRCCCRWLPQHPFPVMVEPRCGCSVVPVRRYKAADILFQVRLTMKMCWTLERDVLSTQSSLQA